MTSKTSPSARQHSYVLPIVIMFALFFMIAFVTGYQNPLGDVIKRMTGDNVVMSQLGTLANFIAYAFMGYPAGKILERKGYRMTALYAVSVGFAGVFITYLSGFLTAESAALTVYLAGAFVAGFSMCMLNTVVNPMLNSLGKNEKEGNALVQFGGAFNSLGATLAPVIVGGLLGGAASSIASANPVFYLAMGIFAAAFIVLYFSKLPEAKNFGTDKSQSDIRVAGALKYRNFAFGLAAIFCYVGIEVGIANMTLQYLSGSPIVKADDPSVEPLTIAGTIVGIYWLLMLVGRLLGGVLGSKVSSRVMLSVVAVTAIVLLCLALTTAENAVPFIGFSSATLSFSSVTVPMNAIFLILCGLCTSVMWGAIYNLSVQGLGRYTAIASGLFMVMVCGGGILPMIQSFIAEQSSVLASFWLPVILVAYLLIYALFLSKPSPLLPEQKETLFEDGKEVEI